MNRLSPCTFVATLVASLFVSHLPAQEPVGAESAPKAEKEAVHKLRIAGSYADLPEAAPDLSAALLGGMTGPPKAFYELIERLDSLAADEKAPQTLVWDLSVTPGFNAAQHAEIARSIGKVRASGRRTIAYFENASTSTYRLACLCDEILMADMGLVELTAPAMEVPFMKDALDLLGVQMDVVRCGDFKGAVEPYMLSSMSAHLREHYRAMLASINQEVVDVIARSRSLAPSKVRELQGQRIISAQRALELGLVDKLVPWSGVDAAYARARGDDNFEFKDAIRDRKDKKEINPLVFLGQLLNGKKKSDETEAWGIAVLHLSGGIVDGTERAPGSIVSGPTVRAIRSLQNNDEVQGVVVRINSPGGSATASEAILLALQELQKHKPVVCSMGQVAASGGYYVTCFGAPILAERGTITGSIGVFGMKPNAGALMRRVGVHFETVGLDESAGMGSLARGWQPDERERMQSFVNEIYDRFLAHVAGSRRMAVADVAGIAGGRVWAGQQALDLGLVDAIGGLEDAVHLVAEKAGIADKKYQVSHVPEPTDFLESLLGSFASARVDLLADPVRADAARAVFARFGSLSGALQLLQQCLARDGQPQVWALAPPLTIR